MTPRLILGIGNPDCGDDGAGPMAVDLLRAQRPPGTALATARGDAATILGHLMRARSVVLLDACRSGAPPGSIRRFDVTDGALPPAHCALSSHGLGLSEALSLAAALGTLPQRCIVLAVEGTAFGPGVAMTPAVRDALPALAEAARAAVR